MSVAPGAHFGPYEILGPLGAGGMGQVYRARDSRLDRIVALKVIAPDLADLPAHRQRLRREARAISSLNHPNICALYDVGEQDDITFLVMEYLEGETVAARLLRGPIPLDELLRRAKEVAAALDHAHRHGVVHRDLKPSNVMLTNTGAKLLDFGLAKLRPTDAVIVNGSPRIPETETIPVVATIEGTILGTVQYMAPEQLEGKNADGRTDIFAFGALIYEMATGQKAFAGGSQASLIAAILRSEPPRISSADPLAPPALDHIVTRCLAKDPDERWQTARDLMIELRGIEVLASGEAASATTLASKPDPADAAGALEGPSEAAPRNRRERLAWAVAAMATLAAAGMGALFWRLETSSGAMLADRTASPAIRSEIPAPDGTSVGSIALSLDGRHLVFVGRRGVASQLWLRPLDSVSARPLPNTEGADNPFWSPDGRSVGFFADGKLKTIDVSGGPVQTLADAPNNRGGAWGRAGTIVFSPGSQALYRVAAKGGPVEAVTQLDTSRGETSHRWPNFLPDGEHFLYLARGSVPENRGLFVASLDTSAIRTFVARTDTSGAYVAPGYLLFLREEKLMAQRFRIERLETEDSPIPLAEPISVNGLERAQFEISPGSLIYRRGSFLGSSEMVWHDPSGSRIETVGPPADYRGVRVSPDGGHIAIGIEDRRVGAPDVWVHDVARNFARKFTFDAGTDRDPVWLPGSRELAVRSDRNERSTIYVKALDTKGGERRILESSQNAVIHDWSRDDQVLFSQVDPAGKTDRDIWILPAQGNQRPYPLVTGPLNQDYPRFSPSGRLVSYQTDESARSKVQVVPFPATGDKWEISPQGGFQPIWRPDGKQLFYVALDNTIMAVDVREGPTTVQFGTPRALFQVPIAVTASGQPSWMWDVSADGNRFLIILAKDDPAPLTLVTNWLADLKNRTN